MRIVAALLGLGACRTPDPSNALLGDRDRHDVTAIRAHGWELWQRLSGGAWDAYTPTEQLFDGAPAARPRFRTPRPFREGDGLETETLPVMFDVVFDPHATAHIRANELAKRSHLATLAAMPAFPSDAVAVKLVWYAVHARGLTTMPIWDGEPTYTDADGNPDRSWPRAIAVDPERDTVPGDETTTVTLEDRPVVAHVVPLSRFIHHALETDDEIASARGAAHDPTLARGDEVALVAVHVTTKEIPDWTWETYWWHDRPDTGRFAAGRPLGIHGAAASYLMDVTYSADQPCFNPWLEARFPNGTQSNCVTCHQRAVVGAADYLPVTLGRMRADDPYFRGHPPTDFVWSIAFDAR